MKKLIFDIKTKSFYEEEISEEELDNSKLQYKTFKKQQRIAELQQLLSSTDYKCMKFAEGLLSNEEYEPIKKQRQEWRDEINELEKLF